MSEKFTKYNLYTCKSPAFIALSVYAKALYPKIKLEWRGANFNNNGSIRFSVRQAATFLGCCTTTANKAFHELRAKGFLVVTTGAKLGSDGLATGHCYELTEIPMPMVKNARYLFKSWIPESDFSVTKARANNPNGRNRKYTNPTISIGSPNQSDRLNPPYPNIAHELLSQSGGPKGSPPNLRGRSSLGTLKGNTFINSETEEAMQTVALGKGLCGRAIARAEFKSVAI